jgi:hypothetical protein
MKKGIIIFCCLIPFLSIAQEKSSLRFKQIVHDFGEIKEADGPATNEFSFVNNSDKPLTIINVNAACGCTTPGWSKEPVPPGQTGYVKAQYDPKGRPGFFNKSLSVFFDDGETAVLQIKGRVLPLNAPFTAEFPAKLGGLRFKSNSVNLGKVFVNQGTVQKEIGIYNDSETTISVKEILHQQKYLTAEVLPAVLAPKQKAFLRITYHADLKGAFGFQTDHIEVVTNDQQMPVKSFNIYAMIEEDYSGMSEAELAMAPTLQLDQLAYDYGRLKANTKAEKNFTISNTGKSKLIIKDIQSNCTCVSSSVDKMIIKPGESSSLKITFDTEGRKANQPKVVSIYSNDPRNPVQRIALSAYVEAN